MKNLLTSTLVLLISLLPAKVSAQEEITFTDLQQMTAVLNSQLPISLGVMMEWQSIDINTKQFTLRYSVNDTDDAIAKGKVTQEDLYESLRMNIAGLFDEDAILLFQAVCSFGIETRIVLTSENTGDKIQLVLTPEQMMEIMETEVEPEEMLQYRVKATKKSLPMTISNGVIFADVALTQDFMINTAIVDEAFISIDQMMANKENMRYSIIEVANNDVSSLMELMLCIGTERGFKYIYKGNNSGKKVEIVFTFAELVELFGFDEDEDVEIVEE